MYSCLFAEAIQFEKPLVKESNSGDIALRRSITQADVSRRIELYAKEVRL